MPNARRHFTLEPRGRDSVSVHGRCHDGGINGMNLGGLTDSVASVLSDIEKCPRCNSASRITHGLCVSCLLQSGLGDDEPEIDSLDAVFAEVEVRQNA